MTRLFRHLLCFVSLIALLAGYVDAAQRGELRETVRTEGRDIARHMIRTIAANDFSIIERSGEFNGGDGSSRPLGFMRVSGKSAGSTGQGTDQSRTDQCPVYAVY